MFTQHSASPLHTSVANQHMSSTNDAQEVFAMQQLAIRTTFTADIFVTTDDGTHKTGRPVYTDHFCNVELDETFPLTASTLNDLIHNNAATVNAAISDWTFLAPHIPNVDCNPSIERTRNFKVDEILAARGASASYSIHLELTVKLHDDESTYVVLRAAEPLSTELLDALLNYAHGSVGEAVDVQSLLEAQYPDHEEDTVDAVLGVIVLDVVGTFTG